MFCLWLLVFFFSSRRRHTRCYRDWSSDVCSSDLDGTVHGFSVQETGVPAGFQAPVCFAIVKVGGLRIFGPILGADQATLRVGATVRFDPIRGAAESKGGARHLVAFRSAASDA